MVGNPVRKCAWLARGAHAVFVALLVAGPAAAQILPAPKPAPTTMPKPASTTMPTPDPNVIQMMAAARPDLLIESVTINDVPSAPYVTQATVVVRNTGQTDAVFPAGSVLVRGEGSFSFLPLTTPQEFKLPVGGSSELSVRVADVCARNPTGTVTFTVDPGSGVAEVNESNNTRAVASASSFAKGDVQALAIKMRGPSNDAGDLLATGVINMDVYVHNPGPGPVLICPGAVLFKETASPLSGTKGLRELRSTATAPKLLPPDQQLIFALSNAIMPGDLPPGSYTWKVLVNPNGDLRETSSANNALTAQVTVK